MNTPMKLALASALLLAVAPGTAQAGLVKICVEYDVFFHDVGPAVGDDYWTSNSPKAALGMQIRLTNDQTGANELIYLEESGPNAGCTPTDVYLNPWFDYTVTLRTRAKVKNNFVAVRPDGHPNLVHGANIPVDSSSSGTLTLTSPANPQWSLMAAAAYSLFRQPAGLSGETFTLWNGGYAPDPGGAYMNTSGELFFAGKTRQQKYVIAHELGHAIKFKHTGGQLWDLSYTVDGEQCPVFDSSKWVHDMFSREWTSAAITEGTAHAYAAVVWNRTSDADCYFWDYKDTDPDRDGNEDSRRLHCTGPFQAQSSGMWFSGANYYDEIPCGFQSTHDNNTATAFDWMRFWWAMMAEEGLQFSDVASIFAAADPDTWLYQYHYNGNNWPDMPTRRIKQAAYGLGFEAEYDAQDHHGVWR